LTPTLFDEEELNRLYVASERQLNYYQILGVEKTARDEGVNNHQRWWLEWGAPIRGLKISSPQGGTGSTPVPGNL
jgi:hypothetical protein